MVLRVCVSLQLDYYVVSERWALGDVKAVFSRRYLHQNKALEIFFANRCKHVLYIIKDRLHIKRYKKKMRRLTFVWDLLVCALVIDPEFNPGSVLSHSFFLFRPVLVEHLHVHVTVYLQPGQLSTLCTLCTCWL